MKSPHPIFIFIFSLVALCLSLFLYIHWYLKITENIDAFVTKFKIEREMVFDPQSFLIIFITSFLVGCIIVGLAIIFSYYHKSMQLYRLQENFINNFTHELKTPLASIKLYLETFLKYQLDPAEQKKFIHYMLKDTERLSEHVNQILQLANIENKNVNYQIEEIDIEKAIETFLQQNYHLFENGDIIVKNLSPVPIIFPLNISLFEILLMNLLTNAFKYNFQRPSINIELSKKGNTVILSFEDNGIGLDTKHYKKIFKKFYQVGQADNCTAQGSGLGLYLSQQVVKFHKGKIRVESPGNNQGCKFILSFPYLKKSSTNMSLKIS